MNNETVLVSVDAEGIATVTLNRPQALNAVNAALRDAMIATLTSVNRDDKVRAVIVTGAGERAFCSGQDLEEASEFTADQVAAWLTHQRAFFQAIRDLDKPAVAALNGVAAGAGFQVGLLCDLRVGYPELKIGQPEIRAGLASIIGSYLMTLHLPLSKNIELSLTGNLISGSEAHTLSLINHLVARGEVMCKAQAVARELAAQAPTAVKATKQRFRELTQAGFDASIEAGIAANRQAYAAGEPQARMKEFLAQRAKK
jgi:enoyl-CoA hydratase/carnithine racemase